MTKKRLAGILRWRWWLHTTLTSIFFIFAAFFFFFAFEDKYYEDQLTHIGSIIAQNDSVEYLPPHIQKWDLARLPQDWHQQIMAVQTGKAIEVSDTDGVQVHLLRLSSREQKVEFVLSLDTGKTQSIWAVADKLLLLFLPWMLLFLLLATILANRFTGRISRHFEQLLHTVKQSSTPEPLWQYAQKQKIDELAQFARLFAEIWQQKLDIVEREKQGLSYLSHELRTPLQSSIATLELLALKMPEQENIGRLQRSLNRMTRLSNTILCLMENDAPQHRCSLDVFSVCRQLVDELQLLAKSKNQNIVLTDNRDTDNNPVVEVPATIEVIETLLSILLTNALTHSNNNPITVTVEAHHIEIVNESLKLNEKSKDSTDGYGIGLTIAQRLSDKFQLPLELSHIEQKQFIATLSLVQKANKSLY